MVNATDSSRSRASASIAFRVDSSPILGTGHLARCLIIGTILAARGASVTFFCREEPGNANELALAKGFKVSPVNASLHQLNSADDATSQPLCQAIDALQTIALLPRKVDCVIVDHYACGTEWESAVRPHCRRLIVIDDLARAHSCDLLIDPNWHGPKTNARYTGRLDSTTHLLIGPDYALLHPAFEAHRVTPTDRRTNVKRVLVYFGGSDRQGLTSLVLTALRRPEFAHLEVDVVIGATNPAGSLEVLQAVNSARFNIYTQQDSLATLLAHADLAIGAVGGTTWERMCLGVPSLTVIVADNQTETANDLAEAGLIDLIGSATEFTEEAFVAHLRDLLADPQRRQRMADGGQALVDGRGAERVVDELFRLIA